MSDKHCFSLYLLNIQLYMRSTFFYSYYNQLYDSCLFLPFLQPFYFPNIFCLDSMTVSQLLK